MLQYISFFIRPLPKGETDSRQTVDIKPRPKRFMSKMRKMTMIKVKAGSLQNDEIRPWIRKKASNDQDKGKDN